MDIRTFLNVIFFLIAEKRFLKAWEWLDRIW